MKCFLCGSASVAKRLKLATRSKIVESGLSTNNKYCGPCLSRFFKKGGIVKEQLEQKHNFSIEQIRELRGKCGSFINCGGKPSYEKLLALRDEVSSVKTWSISVFADFDQAVKRANELAGIVSVLHSSIRFCENAVSNLIKESYEARRAAANAFTANKLVREAVFKRDGMKCKKCGSDENPSLDHIVPVVAGGEDTLENIQVLCISCNCSKKSKPEGCK